MNVSRPIMWPIASLAIAVMASGFSQTAQAQSTLTATPDETGVSIGLPKIDGSPNSLVPGILPPASPGGMRNYFSTRGNRGIVLGNPANDSESDQSLFWLEMDSQPTSSNGIAAQIGIGFAPRPDLGFAFAANQQHFVQRDSGAFFGVEQLDFNNIVFLDAVLFTTGFDDCVHSYNRFISIVYLTSAGCLRA